MENQKNFVWAMVLSLLTMVIYWYFIGAPAQREIVEYHEQQQRLEQQAETAAPTPAATPVEIQSREDVMQGAIATGGRVNIDTPSLQGSFSLDGARFDDLSLKNYNKALDPTQGKKVILTPEGADHAAYVFDNWAIEGSGNGSNAQWSLISGETLTPQSPVTIAHRGAGFTVTRTISVDEDYLITLDDVVNNTSAGDISLSRIGASRQHDLPEDLTNFFILQEGPIAIVDEKLTKMKYKKLTKESFARTNGASGWVGLTDKYWLAAAIAPQELPMSAIFEYGNRNGQDVYEARYELANMTVSAGASLQSTGYIYAGAKRSALLSQYMAEPSKGGHGIARMDMAIDWGLLGPLTRPMSWALSYFGKLLGNFGLGILLITLIIKLILFPLNNKAYASQAKMRAVAPQVKKMQERYKEDRPKLQQEMMALYRKEGVNPVGGCLPMIPQIFVFFALYKSLFINVDMRHAPFYGWIKDLSAKDPLSFLNGFGLFPWDAVPIGILAFLAIGPLALMYGISMAAMQTLSPAAGDPMQRKIIQFMPWVFMFVLAPFAAGLLVYWVWNNILSFLQQYYITRKFGVETPFDNFFNKILGRPNKSELEEVDKFAAAKASIKAEGAQVKSQAKDSDVIEGTAKKTKAATPKTTAKTTAKAAPKTTPKAAPKKSSKTAGKKHVSKGRSKKKKK